MMKAISGLMQRSFKHDTTVQHWLVITNRRCVINTIRIYCSLQLNRLMSAMHADSTQIS